MESQHIWAENTPHKEPGQPYNFIDSIFYASVQQTKSVEVELLRKCNAEEQCWVVSRTHTYPRRQIYYEEQQMRADPQHQKYTFI